MRISNEPQSETAEAFGEFVQLQTEFHARLAEETLKYLRRIQGAALPSSPGTIVLPNRVSELRATASPGSSAELKLEIENQEQVHCVITPMLSPLVETSGVTWFPTVELAPPTILLPPSQIAKLSIRLALPPDIPVGTYRGVLMLLGFTAGGIAVTVEVRKAKKGAAKKGTRSGSKKKSNAKAAKAGASTGVATKKPRRARRAKTRG